MVKISLKEIVEKSFKDCDIFFYITERLKIDYTLDIERGVYQNKFNDFREIGRIFENLISNSVKSIYDEEFPLDPEDLYNKKDFYIKVRLSLSDEDYLITVEDNGPGIEQENMKDIFNCGFSTFGTTGAGLWIVKNSLEENYNGRIEVESEPYTNTKFSIYIPK